MEAGLPREYQRNPPRGCAYARPIEPRDGSRDRQDPRSSLTRVVARENVRGMASGILFPVGRITMNRLPLSKRENDITVIHSLPFITSSMRSASSEREFASVSRGCARTTTRNESAREGGEEPRRSLLAESGSLGKPKRSLRRPVPCVTANWLPLI